MKNARITILRWTQKSGEISKGITSTTSAAPLTSESHREAFPMGQMKKGKIESGGTLDLSNLNRRLRGNSKIGDIEEIFTDTSMKKG